MCFGKFKVMHCCSPRLVKLLVPLGSDCKWLQIRIKFTLLQKNRSKFVVAMKFTDFESPICNGANR